MHIDSMPDDKIDAAVQELLDGKIKPYEVESLTGTDSVEATHIRKRFLEKKFGITLKHIGSSTIDFNDAVNRNIESSIGAAQVPLGYAGDIKVNGDSANGSYPVLLATTVGRLVAGISRGISVVNRAGGVNTIVVRDGMARDVLVRASDARHSSKLAHWIEGSEGREFIGKAFAESTTYGALIDVKPFVAGRDVHLRFRATTGAAMGMNMVTISAKSTVDKLVQHAEDKLGLHIDILSESGNMCSDKKPAYIDFIEGRGVSVTADIVVPGQLIEESFRVRPEIIVELNKVKNLTGSALAGSHGFNAHVANTLAAMYIAHGQDAAQIVEGTMAITDAAMVGDDLYVSLLMPSIEVGTYGGGTARETQKEALSLMGLYGSGDAEGKTRLAFAEVVAATCLTGELNLLAAEAGMDLAKSHSKIKR
jgi:hydroxymethylglutaryl-CoA reductase (NADPH)